MSLVLTGPGSQGIRYGAHGNSWNGRGMGKFIGIFTLILSSKKANLHAAICLADLSATTNRGANWCV